jgi:hypothetical protein
MEKASGVSLKSKWLELSQQEAGKLAHSFLKIEETLSKLPFSSTGSLYFRKDITPSLQTSLYQKDHAGEDDKFCIGPIADYMFCYGRRAGLKLNRGPWQSHADYLLSIAHNEIEWTQRYGRSMEPPTFPHNALGLGVHSPEEHVKLLDLTSRWHRIYSKRSQASPEPADPPSPGSHAWKYVHFPRDRAAYMSYRLVTCGCTPSTSSCWLSHDFSKSG